MKHFIAEAYGSKTACGVKPGRWALEAGTVTPDPAKVTCKRCLKSLERRPASQAGGLGE